MRRFGVLVGVLGLLTTTTAPPGVAAGGWSPPVDGPVVRSFERPSGRFGPGHRGVDYAVPSGTPVRAAGAGRVVFAGPVAGGLHVVVGHPGGLRTGYSFLSRISVNSGEAIARGAIVGLSGGTGPAHEPGVFHFSLREGTGYVDPMRLVATAPVVRLAPVDGPAPRACPPRVSPEGQWRPAATLTGDPAFGRESSRPQSHR
jgi:murein DD-endopeptidase MepM/ murein hydrolase activator NlpD